MRKRNCMRCLIKLGLMLTLSPVQATLGDGSEHDEWQLRRLFEPNQAELLQEKNKSIMIYSGVKDKDVGRVMDEHFDRIDSMMFVRTIVTDKTGEPKTNPESGEVVSEDDDCE